MKLEYKILWVEDTPSAIRGAKRIIENHIKDKGFDITIKPIENYDDFEIEVTDVMSLKNYDLLLIDLDLGEEDIGKNSNDGNKIIKKIRDSDVYTEIIFYSSEYSSLQSKIQEHFLEGVFTSTRDMISTKAKDVIDVTLHKIQDVNNLRGLIMAEVAELDRLKEKIIKNATLKISNKELEKYMLQKVKSSIDSNTNKLNSFNADIDSLLIKDLLNSRGLIDSDKKRLAVGKTLEKLSITEPIDKVTFLEPYKENILSMRNLFAHVEECDGTDEYGETCKVIGDIPFTEKKCIEIRKEIKKYKKILMEIEEKINE